jgi:nitronate monooxygenase
MNTGHDTSEKYRLKKLVIGDLVASLPIIQGGMGVGISLAGLASAVANEGGIGVIATAGIAMDEPDLATNFVESNTRALRKQIGKAREMTKGILGVNIMCALSNYDELARAAVEEGIDIVISGAGLPMNLPQYRSIGNKTKFVPIVSSARAASIIIRRWWDRFRYLPDAIIVEGPLAGGHLGFKREQIEDSNFALSRIFPEVCETVNAMAKEHHGRVPVIAAGGIYTGADILKYFELGAAGVQMATRFVTTHECDAAMGFKQAYLDAEKDDLIIIQSPVGMPGRAIRNKFIDDVNRGERKPYNCLYRCIVTCDVKHSPYCIARCLLNAKNGLLAEGFAFAGANAYRAKTIVSVKQLIASLVEEYRVAVLAQRAPA